MRFIASPTQEQYESTVIPVLFAKRYAPHGRVVVGTDSILSRPGVELVDLHGETLAIQPDTAAWAFLSVGEQSLYVGLDGKPFSWLENVWPADAPYSAAEFVEILFRRGLVNINGYSAIEESIFEESANVQEGHLVELLLTEKCNLGCVYCLAGTNAKMPIMTSKTARRAVDLAFGMNEAEALAFEFSGGEPFMNFGLMKEMVAYIHDHPHRNGRQVYLNVQTNGTLLNQERVRWIKEHDVRLGLSLDGNPASHNKSRPQLGGGESFSRLIAGIGLLQQYEVPFGALVVLNRYNVGSVTDLVRFLLEHNIRSFKLNPVAFLGTARTTWDDVGLTQGEVIAYFTEFGQLVARSRLWLLEGNLHTMCDFLTSKQRRTRCMRSHCGAGDTFQAVSANGDVYPCGRTTQTPAMKMGNVTDSSFVSLSQLALSHELVGQIRERRPHSLDDCRVCPYRQMCQAGCSALAYERHGTVRHKTPECALYKTMYPYLMRWLSFERPAFETLRSSGYFDPSAILFETDFVP